MARDNFAHISLIREIAWPSGKWGRELYSSHREALQITPQEAEIYNLLGKEEANVGDPKSDHITSPSQSSCVSPERLSSSLSGHLLPLLPSNETLQSSWPLDTPWLCWAPPTSGLWTCWLFLPHAGPFSQRSQDPFPLLCPTATQLDCPEYIK